MGAGGDHRAGRADKLRVDVIDRQPHIGAVLAVEDQRELFLVADTEQHQSGQAVGVGLDPGRIHALFLQLLADEPTHMLITDPCDHRRAQPEPCRSARDVGRRAADILVE